MKSAIILQDVNRNRNQMHVLKIDPIDQMVTSRRNKMFTIVGNTRSKNMMTGVEINNSMCFSTILLSIQTGNAFLCCNGYYASV